MFETNSPPRRLAVPLGHKLIAVVIAVAVALGAHAWLSRIAHTTSSAELSFDATAARRIDPGLADAPSPALAIAQSLLTDQVVAGLAKPAHLSSSSIATRIGEFRARLDLTQPSAHVLRVQFRDSDSAKSAATANAVAHTLASGSPLTPPPPASAPTAPPQIAPSQSALLHSAPGPPPATSHIGQSANSLSASLGDLESQLASTDRDLDRLSSPEKRPKGWRRSYAHELPSYTQARERKLLKSAVVTAQAQLNNLRSKYANENPGIQNRLAEIQQQLSAILPASSASKHRSGKTGFNAAGTNAAELRREREQLSQTLSVVERDRQAIQREEAASGPASAVEPRPAPNLAAQPAASPQQQSAPVVDTQSSAAGSQNPFTIAHLATIGSGKSRSLASWWPPSWWPSSTERTPWWPASAAGLLCGLFYFAFARHYRPVDYEDSGSEPVAYSSYRIITPDPPPVTPTPAPTNEPSPGVDDLPSYDSAEPTPNKRASFTFDPPTPRRTPFDTPPLQPTPSVTEPEGPVEIAEPRVVPADQPAPLPENVVEIADTWSAQIARTLAQTEIGRMLEGSSAEHDATGTSQESNDSQKTSPRPNRRAG